eukprot:TRINITY_DN9725_c0_g1_i2.p1 TRINITY_DN9725_c0_g1~~TRINITY_DN9725_c0_g1_i2.p1  ORF type:complete len:667 (+),score=171.23 TRINITY_DN9725_c0_g1_i2:94-2094(+)
MGCCAASGKPPPAAAPARAPAPAPARAPAPAPASSAVNRPAPVAVSSGAPAAPKSPVGASLSPSEARKAAAGPLTLFQPASEAPPDSAHVSHNGGMDEVSANVGRSFGQTVDQHRTSSQDSAHREDTRAVSAPRKPSVGFADHGTPASAFGGQGLRLRDRRRSSVVSEPDLLITVAQTRGENGAPQQGHSEGGTFKGLSDIAGADNIGASLNTLSALEDRSSERLQTDGQSTNELGSDTWNNWEAEEGFDFCDDQRYEDALRSWKRVHLQRGVRSLLSVLGVAVLRGLGDEAWAARPQELTPEPGQLASAERWLSERDSRIRGKDGSKKARGSPSALLALAEFHKMCGDEQKAAEVRQRAAERGHPLAKLRCVLSELHGLRAQPVDAAERKKAVVNTLSELAQLQDRVGAKAGLYLWPSFYKGTEGKPRDLRMAERLLERCLRYGMEAGAAGSIGDQLAKVRRKLDNRSRPQQLQTSENHSSPRSAGQYPSSPASGISPPHRRPDEAPRSPARGVGPVRRSDSMASHVSNTSLPGASPRRGDSAASFGSHTSQGFPAPRSPSAVLITKGSRKIEARGQSFTIAEVMSPGGRSNPSPSAGRRPSSPFKQWAAEDDDDEATSDDEGPLGHAAFESPRQGGGKRYIERGAQIKMQLRQQRAAAARREKA